MLLLAGILLWPRLRQALDQVTVPQANTPLSAEELQALGDQRLYLPVGPSDQVVHHSSYSLGYDNDWEQPRWVAYTLTGEQVRAKSLPRSDDFRPDAAVRDGSATGDDYRNSGYSRGHLVPSGDFNFNHTSMSDTYLYSNISPQLRSFNGGVWRELEECVRDWALRKGPIYVVSGPVIVERPSQRIGSNGVAVPEAFYKVILSERGEAIGFVIPHDVQTQSLTAFAKTVDEVESATGLDFWPELTTLANPETEAHYDLQAWPIDQARYQRRIELWNKQ